jgi:glycosyltransferase involved in cell wall biosynthesis
MHLSIIIPAFNEEPDHVCLDSIRITGRQSKTGFTSEVIVVDNNSTDKPPNWPHKPAQSGVRTN